MIESPDFPGLSLSCDQAKDARRIDHFIFYLLFMVGPLPVFHSTAADLSFGIQEHGMAAEKRLTAKMKRFIEEYLVDLNATQAVIRAGYNPANASAQAYNLMQKEKVAEAISRAMAERSRRTGISQDRVIEELAKIAFLRITDVVDPENATVLDYASEADIAAIESIRVKEIPTQAGVGIEREVKVASKLKALELLGKHLGMWDDRTNVNVTVPVVLKDDVHD